MKSLYSKPSAERPAKLIINLPKDQLKRVDEWGMSNGMQSRTAAVRELLNAGLKAVASAAADRAASQ